MAAEESSVIENLTKMEDKADIKKETNELTTEIKFEIDNTKDDNPFREVQLEVKEELQEGKYTKDIDETKDTEANETEVSELKTEEFTLKFEREQEVLPEEYNSQDEGSMDSDDAVALHNVEACLEDEEMKTEDYVGEETHAHAAAAAAAPANRPLIANENVEELIDEVEKRPALYKKDMKQYSDINIKEKLWEEVCAVVINNWSELNAFEKREKGRDVKKKWSNLRTCFARELKAQKSVKTGQAASKRRPYIYFERMMFLVPCMEPRLTDGSIEASESNQYDLSVEAQPHRQRKRKAKQSEFKEQLLNAHYSKEQLLNAHHSKEQLLNAHHTKEQLFNAHHPKEQLFNAHHSKEQLLLNALYSKEQLLNAHHSKEQLLSSHHFKEQLLNAHHSKEQLLNAHHSKEQSLNTHHTKEQLLYAHHSTEQLLNAHHSKEQLINAHHSKEQLLNAHHSKEQLFNAHHSKEQLLNAHHSKEDDDTNYCLSLVPFMKELTADEKLEVRIHILKMFQDIKKRRQFQNISFIQPDTSQSQVTRRALQIIKSKHSRPSRRLHTNQTFTSQSLIASQVSQQQYNITESYPLTSPSSESQTPPSPQYGSE